MFCKSATKSKVPGGGFVVVVGVDLTLINRLKLPLTRIKSVSTIHALQLS